MCQIERSPGACKALQSLHDAHLGASAAESRIWTFAVEFPHLLRAGCSTTDLGMLVCAGLVVHAEEITRRGESDRCYRNEPTMCFHRRSCFVLTDRGLEFASALNSQQPLMVSPSSESKLILPSWDAEQRELRFGVQPVISFQRPAPVLELILSAFEELGWPSQMDDPLTGGTSQDRTSRLQDAMKRLNRCQRPPLLLFGGDGSGRVVRWRRRRHSH